MKETLKNNKGITLVALVVTIIILIILAGISINMLIGTDGLITKAQQAKENIELAEIEEQTRLNELYSQLDNGLSGTGNSFVEQTAGTATSDKILKDYTAFVNGQLVTGIMEDRSGQTLTATTIAKSGDNLLVTVPENGYYDDTSKLSISADDIRDEIGGSISFYVNTTAWDPSKAINTCSIIYIPREKFNGIKIEGVTIDTGYVQLRNSDSSVIIDVSGGGTFNFSDYTQLGETIRLFYGEKPSSGGTGGVNFKLTLYY